MKDSWEREAEYQFSELLLTLLMDKGLLTNKEFKAAQQKLRVKTNPPVAGLAS